MASLYEYLRLHKVVRLELDPALALAVSERASEHDGYLLDASYLKCMLYFYKF